MWDYNDDSDNDDENIKTKKNIGARRVFLLPLYLLYFAVDYNFYQGSTGFQFPKSGRGRILLGLHSQIWLELGRDSGENYYSCIIIIFPRVLKSARFGQIQKSGQNFARARFVRSNRIPELPGPGPKSGAPLISRIFPLFNLPVFQS